MPKNVGWAKLLTVRYILFRVGGEPGKLKTWGITTPITGSALLTGLALLLVALGMLVAGGIAAAGALSFEPAYLTQMVEYILAALSQEFVMCSVGLATLAALRLFRGLWRLPIVVGLVFSLAHFWTPARIPAFSRKGYNELMINIETQIGHWRDSRLEELEVARVLIAKKHVRQGLFWAQLTLEKMLKAHVCK